MENENIIQPPVPAPVAQTAIPVSVAPNKSNKRLVVLVILFIIIAAVGITAYALGAKTQSVPTPQPTPLAVVQPTPTPDPTADWKTYTSSLLNLSFKYPTDWFVEENASAINIRIQNYDPKTAPGRGYDPIQDKGKYLLTISRLSELEREGNNILTINDLKLILPKNGDSGFYMGDPVKQIFIKNEKEFLINNYPAYYFEKVYPDLQITEHFTYLLDGKSKIIFISPGLDVVGGKSQTDQILSTFKFTE